MVAFNDRIVARFLQATLLWGCLGLLTGFHATLERLHWPANGSLAFFSFGRLQTVHTTIMLYAWAANAFFAGLYYALQRLCASRIWSDRLASIHFWSWQLVLLGAVVSLGLGMNQGRALAEMEWIFDSLILGVWLLFALNVALTMHCRRNSYLYISLWFFLAVLLGFPLLHAVNALCFPMSLRQSYPLFPGVLDALLQGWFEQNINVVLLILPFLGIMYYFVPKASERPVHSFRLALFQFWTLLVIAAWLGPRQLLFSSLPEWLQSLGFVAGLMLLAPALGAMVNGFRTLGLDVKRGWGRPILVFFALALACYGIFAFAEALTAFKSLHFIVQYTDWEVARSQLLLYGWAASCAFGLAYGLVPKLWAQRLYSKVLALMHIGLHFVGLLLLVVPMAVSGVIQGLGWSARLEDGQLLNTNFVLPFKFLKTMGNLHLIGYTLIGIGTLLATFNFIKTTRYGVLQDESRDVITEDRRELRPWVLCLGIVLAMVVGIAAEFGGLMLSMGPPNPVRTYTALELQGRDLYVREGCVQCHTQMVRWSLREELRYGPASEALEYQYQGPTLWGQKRIGPDLHRVGGRYPDFWHYQHLMNPRSQVATSTMPAYPWLSQGRLQNPRLPREQWEPDALKIQGNLVQAGMTVEADAEIIALIAYLQRLGTDRRQ